MLDIGCGTGHMLIRFGANYSQLTGIDHSEGMLSAARTNLEAAGLAANLVQQEATIFLSEQKECYDLVTCVGFLHHLKPVEISLILGGVRKALKPEGRIIIAEPIDNGTNEIPAAILNWNSKSIASHLTYENYAEEPEEAPISLSHLKQCFGENQLEVVTENRCWELLPRKLPPSFFDRVTMSYLHSRFGKRGNVYAALLQHVS